MSEASGRKNKRDPKDWQEVEGNMQSQGRHIQFL